MSVSDADIAFAIDLFAPLGGLSSRKMFGGLMIYHDGQAFCLLSSSGILHLKAKGRLADDMTAQGARQFSPVMKNGKGHNMGYWTLPDAALDDPDEAMIWARRALDELT